MGSSVFCAFLHGPTGCGKTLGSVKFLNRTVGAGNYFVWSPKHSKGWWDGYAGEDWVLLDDYDAEAICVGEMLRILQALPANVPVHGGVVAMNAHNFILSSNKSLDQLFPGPRVSDEQRSAIRRRITWEISRDEMAELMEEGSGQPRINKVCSMLEQVWEDHRPEAAVFDLT